MAKPVALVLVSHSDLLARGVAEVAQQMAPDVLIIPAGGSDQGEIGTNFDKIDAAVNEAITAGAVAILSDLGSATMTVENVLEFLGDDNAQWIDGPLVEGAVLAAVAAQGGGSLETVLNAVKEAATQWTYAEDAAPAVNDGQPAETVAVSADGISAEVALVDPDGLHARPAALVARKVVGFDATVTINGADAKSVLSLMGLNAKCGDVVTVAATGADATAAVDAVVAELSK